MSRKRVVDGQYVDRFSVSMPVTEIAEMESHSDSFGNGNISGFIRKLYLDWKNRHEKAMHRVESIDNWKTADDLLNGIERAIVGEDKDVLTELNKIALIQIILRAALKRLTLRKEEIEDAKRKSKVSLKTA